MRTKGRIARDGATVRRAQVMLDDETVQRARALGDGNISLGLRRAVKEAGLQVQSQAREKVERSA